MNLADLDKLRNIDSLESLQSNLNELDMTPGWVRMQKPPLWKEMRSEYVPAHWRYEEAKAAMQAAGKLIGTDLAERRNFIMRNPEAQGSPATVRTLVAAYQSILPGEKARSHRHAPHALRVILDVKGAYSIVDGHKHPMETGDIVLTPGWCWHGHGHDGSEQAYWMDGLDVPLTHLLEPMFFEEHPAGFEPITNTDPQSPMRFTWAATRQALKSAAADAHMGSTIVLPAPTMPTITLKVHHWPAGFRNRPYRHSAHTVLVVMQGAGEAVIGGKQFDWQFGDTIAVPGWSRTEIHAQEESVIFAMSDEELIRWSRYYRLEALE